MLLVCIYISIHFYMIPNRSNSWQRLHHVSQMAVNTYCCISLLYLLYLPLLLLSSTFVLHFCPPGSSNLLEHHTAHHGEICQVVS